MTAATYYAVPTIAYAGTIEADMAKFLADARAVGPIPMGVLSQERKGDAWCQEVSRYARHVLRRNSSLEGGLRITADEHHLWAMHLPHKEAHDGMLSGLIEMPEQVRTLARSLKEENLFDKLTFYMDRPFTISSDPSRACEPHGILVGSRMTGSLVSDLDPSAEYYLLAQWAPTEAELLTPEQVYLEQFITHKREADRDWLISFAILATMTSIFGGAAIAESLLLTGKEMRDALIITLVVGVCFSFLIGPSIRSMRGISHAAEAWADFKRRFRGPPRIEATGWRNPRSS